MTTNKLVGDILVQLEADEKNIYIPKTLVEECETNKLIAGLLVNALKQANEMTESDLKDFKEKWSKRIK